MDGPTGSGPAGDNCPPYEWWLNAETLLRTVTTNYTSYSRSRLFAVVKIDLSRVF